jgi:soluble lytic murein transglycosylase-like protein
MATAILFLSGLPALAAPSPVPLAIRHYDVRAYGDFVTEAARRFGIPATWIYAVMQRESGGNPHASSSAGATGLMQIMPATWAELRARYDLGTDPYDPHDNILAGAAYLREMHDRYGSPGFLAAYNAGPARYDEFLGGEQPLPGETRDYLAALTPLVGNDNVAAPVVVTSTGPFLWTAAPIFVALSGSAFAAAPVQVSGQFADRSTASRPYVSDTLSPDTAALFVSPTTPIGVR